MLWAEIFRDRNALISYSGNNLTMPCSLMLVLMGSGLEYYENSGAKLLDRMEMLRTEIFRCRDALIKLWGKKLDYSYGTGSAPLVPSSQENLSAVGHSKGVQLDKEGHTEAALRVFKRNLREPEDGQKGAKLWEKPDRFDQVQVPTKDAAVQAEGLGR